MEMRKLGLFNFYEKKFYEKKLKTKITFLTIEKIYALQFIHVFRIIRNLKIGNNNI
jgi:hypothetical protein